MKTFAIVVLVFALALAGAATARPPRVTLVSVPADIVAGAAWSATLRVRPAVAGVVLVARAGRVTFSARVARARGGLYRARLELRMPGEWRLSARVGRRTSPLGAVDVRSPGARLLEPFNVAVTAEGSLVIPNGRAHNIVALRSRRLEILGGNGADGFAGDGPARSVPIGFPIDAALGPDGDVYVVSAHRVRRIDRATATVSTVAGTGTDGYSGDGGPATAAQLGVPAAVAVDAGGNLYIAEIEGRVRRVDGASGVITTYAGIGRLESSGDGGPATAAGIARPHGLCVAPDGAVHVADTDGGRLRRIDPATGVISSVAANLAAPVHCAVGPEGSVYVAEAQGNRVVRVRDGIATVFAGIGTGISSGDGGPAARAGLDEPAGVAVAADGTVYISELDGRRIRRVDRSGTITTVAR